MQSKVRRGSNIGCSCSQRLIFSAFVLPTNQWSIDTKIMESNSVCFPFDSFSSSMQVKLTRPNVLAGSKIQRLFNSPCSSRADLKMWSGQIEAECSVPIRSVCVCVWVDENGSNQWKQESEGGKGYSKHRYKHFLSWYSSSRLWQKLNHKYCKNIRFLMSSLTWIEI